jgi:hypothetical protein
VVHTTPADQLTNTTARVNGTIDDFGTPSSKVDPVPYHVVYGPTTGYGHTSAMFSTDGSGLQNVHVPISGLSPGTTYHARIDAGLNNTPGEDVTFTTPSQPTLRFTASSYAVGEGQGSATLTVERVGDTAPAVTVHYATSDGSATAGSDYTGASGTLSFAAGETTKNVSVTIADDAPHESDETFTVALSSPSSNSTLGSPGQAQVTITDNDALPTTAVALDPPTPASDGTYKVPVKVTVTGSGRTGIETRCVLDPAQAPAAFGDMPAGCGVSGSTVSAPGAHKVYAASRDSAGSGSVVTRTFTITQNPPVVHTTGADQITNSDARVNGTIDDRGNAVTYHVDYGTTTAYGHSSGAFLTSGTGAQTVHVALAGLSPGTTYHARLVAGSGAGEDISFSTTNLAVLQLKTATLSLAEDKGPATVAVERLGDASQAVTVHYATSDGTAEAGSDYTTASGTLSFAAGETTKDIAVTIVDDAPHESDETLTLGLSGPSSNAVLGSPSQAQIQITDNDALPETAIALDPPTPAAGDAYDGPVKFTVTGRGRDPVETRCVLDPADVPRSFDAIPPGCSSGSTVDAPGSHKVWAASRDSAGAGAVVSRSFTITAPPAPDTTIVDAPSGTIWTAQSLFSFTSTIAGSRFECRIDGGDFSACSSPIESAALLSGPHTFEVRAIGPNGVSDPTPATASFTVGAPSQAQTSCSRSPVQFLEGDQFRVGCLIGQGTLCALGMVCHWETRPCPVGAECVATTTAAYSTADKGRDVTLEAAASFKSLDWTGTNVIPGEVETTCSTGGTSDGCRTVATIRELGAGRPLLTWCQAIGGGVTGPLEEHPDQRRIDCNVNLEIRLAAPLTTTATGTDLQVLAPSQGTLTGTATVAGTTGAGVTSAVARSRIAGFHRSVHARGPLTVHLHPNKAGRRQLRRHHRIHVVVQLTFTPAGGQPQRRRAKVTLTTVTKKKCPKRHGKRTRCLA